MNGPTVRGRGWRDEKEEDRRIKEGGNGGSKELRNVGHKEEEKEGRKEWRH